MADPVKTATIGPAANVPCPWCKKTNDFEGALAVGQVVPQELFSCDHCGKSCQILEVKVVTLISVRQWQKSLPPTEPSK